ncbi:hypothetical protein MASR2M78_27090 [Treponema sp.]
MDNMGSRGCRRVNGQAELSDAVADALRYSKSGRAIVEEYMDGDEYSVDAIVSNGEVSICGLADRHIFFPPYFIEMGHTIPTAISKADEVELLSVFKAGIAALGITNGAAKGDLKLSSKGPMIGEIAARLSGGYMSGWTYPYASLVEPTAAAIAVALGEKPENLEPKRDWTCAERAFISIPGKVLSISGFEEASSLPFVQNVFMRAQVLARVSFPVNNVSKCGNIIAVAPSRSEASEAAEKAARSILIRLAPEDRETEAFLSAPLLGASAFPPDAFIISPSLKAALDLIPPTKKPSTISQGHIAIIDFPALREANLSDYVGRSLNESLEAVRRLCALDLPLVAEAASPRHALQTLLGREFWQALLRASYQGGAYVVDSLLSKAEQVQ